MRSGRNNKKRVNVRAPSMDVRRNLILCVVQPGVYAIWSRLASLKFCFGLAWLRFGLARLRLSFVLVSLGFALVPLGFA